MKRIVALPLIAALGPALGTVLGTVPAHAAPKAALTWSSCGIKDHPKLRCATLRVPLDHARPDGPAISLAISRAADGDPDGKKVLVVNPGGPGASGLGMAGDVFAALPPKLRESYTVVGYDGRGVGRSTPAMSCVPTYFQGPRPRFVPATPSDERAWIQRTSDYSAACGRKYADLLPHMRATDWARDLDSIREALGKPKISYYGVSYGTYIGAVYATLFPHRYDRMVMDGVLAADGPAYHYLAPRNEGFQTNLRMFFRWAASHDDVYGLGTTADRVEKRFYELHARLAEKPALGGVFGSAEFDVTYMGTGYTTKGWPKLAQALSDMLRDGDSAAMAEVYAAWGANPVSDNFNAVVNAVRCTDVPWPRRYSTWRRDAVAGNRTAPFTTWNNMWFNNPCMTWPVKGTPAFPIEGRPGAAPILMFQTEHDPATPLSDGMSTHRLLKSRLVTLKDGWGHGATLTGNRCADGHMMAYLGTGELPAADASCQAGPLPEPETAAPARRS